LFTELSSLPSDVDSQPTKQGQLNISVHLLRVTLTLHPDTSRYPEWRHTQRREGLSRPVSQVLHATTKYHYCLCTTKSFGCY